MAMSHVAYVRTDKGVFFHSIDTESDAITLHDEEENIILMYDACNGVWDTKGNRLGTLRIVDEIGTCYIWAFFDPNGVEMPGTRANDNLKTEVHFSKHYIENVYNGVVA